MHNLTWLWKNKLINTNLYKIMQKPANYGKFMLIKQNERKMLIYAKWCEHVILCKIMGKFANLCKIC